MYENEKATLPGVAETNITQAKSYRQSYEKSRKFLKMRIGEMLLCLVANNDQPEGLQLFDQLLRRLYEGGAI